MASWLSFFKEMGSWLSQVEPEPTWDTRPAYSPPGPRTVEEQVREAIKWSVEEEPLCSDLTSYPFIIPKPETDVAWLVEAKLSELEFWSLRMQVFLVDPRSATPITRLIYGKLTKTEVYALMNGFNKRAEEKVVSVPMNDDWNWKWEKVRVMLQKKGWAPNPRLRTLIEKAREEYSELLRDIEHRDIDVLYTGEDGRTEIYVNDQDRILKAGGKLYARFSTKWDAWTIGMSVILPLKAFEKIFPKDRKNIIIRVNTPPAGPNIINPPKWYGVDSISKSIHPKYAALGPSSSQVELERASREVLEEIHAQIKTDDNFQKIVTAEKARRDSVKAKAAPWYNGFLSFSRADPEWTPDTHPFSQDIPFDNNEWWQADLELKRQIVQEWFEQGGNQHGWEDPEDEDFGLLKKSTQPSYPALCKTLLPEIDLKHRDNQPASEIIRKQYWQQAKLCENLKRPYMEAEEKYLDEPHNLKARMDFMRISKEVMRQQDRLDFWRAQMRGESNNPVKLPITQRPEEPDVRHDSGTAVVLGSKPIDIPSAKGKTLQRIEELSLADRNGEAAGDPPEPKGPRPAKGKAKLYVLSRLAELKAEEEDNQPIFPGPKPIDLRSARVEKPVFQESQPNDPLTGAGEKPGNEASKPIGILSVQGKKRVRFALPDDEGRQVRFQVPGEVERLCP